MTSEGQHAGQQPAEATSGGGAEPYGTDGFPPDSDGQRLTNRPPASFPPPASGSFPPPSPSASPEPHSYAPPPHATPNGGSPFVVPAVPVFGQSPEAANRRAPDGPPGRQFPDGPPSRYGAPTAEPQRERATPPFGGPSSGSARVPAPDDSGALPQRGGQLPQRGAAAHRSVPASSGVRLALRFRDKRFRLGAVAERRQRPHRVGLGSAIRRPRTGPRPGRSRPSGSRALAVRTSDGRPSLSQRHRTAPLPLGSRPAVRSVVRPPEYDGLRPRLAHPRLGGSGTDASRGPILRRLAVRPACPHSVTSASVSPARP